MRRPGDRIPDSLAVEQRFGLALAEALEWRVRIDAQMLQNRLDAAAMAQKAFVLAQTAAVGRDETVGPGQHGSLGDRFLPVGHDPVGIHGLRRAQAVAFGAGAVGAVEGKHPRRQFGQLRSVFGAGHRFAEDAFARRRARRGRLAVAADGFDRGQPFGLLQRDLHRIRQAVSHIGADHQPVDDNRNRMLVALVQRGRRIDLDHFIVDLGAGVAFAQRLVEDLGVFALAPAHHRRHHQQPRAFGILQHGIDNVLHRLAFERPAAFGAMRPAGVGEQHAQIIVYFRDRADGRTRILAHAFLFDGDGGTEAFDMLDLRFLQLIEELAGVARQAFDVAPLALGVNRVERQRGFARSRKAGDHRQGVARDIDADVFQIVFGRADDAQNAGIAHASPAEPYGMQGAEDRAQMTIDYAIIRRPKANGKRNVEMAYSEGRYSRMAEPCKAARRPNHDQAAAGATRGETPATRISIVFVGKPAGNPRPVPMAAGISHAGQAWRNRIQSRRFWSARCSRRTIHAVRMRAHASSTLASKAVSHDSAHIQASFLCVFRIGDRGSPRLAIGVHQGNHAAGRPGRRAGRRASLPARGIPVPGRTGGLFRPGHRRQGAGKRSPGIVRARAAGAMEGGQGFYRIQGQGSAS
ncbi:MAG: hypothetical protein BWZ10_02081 [candidate division BRC1 bacterium ADurb.BinA364]|nr:MAG: hypothetical protein BWZ10_02081 [candidate division BRC1 bacterium ADurb.BinA364]